MQKYNYTARDENGKVIRGMMIAENEIALANKISHLGYFLTGYKSTQESVDRAVKSGAAKLKSKEILQFTYQLSTLLAAGLPLLEGLRNLTQDAANENIQKVVDDVRYRVESGGSLTEAVSMHPQTFSAVYKALVNAGETTGNLPETLEDLTQLLEWQMDLKKKIQEAATYPVILFTVMVGVVILLVVKVIPMFEPIFQEAGANLPLPTKIVLEISHCIQNYWFIFVGGIISLIIGFFTCNRTEKGHYVLDGWKLKLPLFGSLLRKIALSRFAHTFNICFDAGINLLTALDIARQTVGNARIETAIKKAREAVNVGEKLAISLQMTGEFPAMVVRMIAVGEQSGALPHTLDKISRFYDKEVTDTVKTIFALFEPLMIIIMGVVVGGIALSIFLPMFQMAQMVG
ncbi:MAG: type II secretion system F family protein [Candidatus Omnitrophica bacterium]|nr:type II secretion system F family protein [Candidatus Omnitrophota bacterium]MBU4479103.1 type II secretion system F family protein [Candidatus Omnitrophota bacterium]MCG2703420.1 type II secretion system F family protein [Candidatus Omnitrophota bacterium]